MRAMILTAVWIAAALAPAAANATVVPLPSGAVTIEACHWNATARSFDTDIRLADHTNLPIAKARLLLTYISREGESVSSYVDMVGSQISTVSGMPIAGAWRHSVFPGDLQTLRCGLVGVKFAGYPNVIYSAVR